MEINQGGKMRKDTKNDLLVLINTLDNVDDLREVKSMAIDKLESLGRQAKYSLIPGDKVSISGSGKIEKGKIIKINRRGGTKQVSLPRSLFRSQSTSPVMVKEPIAVFGMAICQSSKVIVLCSLPLCEISPLTYETPSF